MSGRVGWVFVGWLVRWHMGMGMGESICMLILMLMLMKVGMGSTGDGQWAMGEPRASEEIPWANVHTYVRLVPETGVRIWHLER